MLQIPQDVLKDLADEHCVSDAELAALSLALNGQSAIEISKNLGISEVAVRKRLGEVYRKFNIKGSGPGKLAALKRSLEERYQAHLEEITTPHQGRSKMPNVPVFYGRTKELNQLEQLLLKDGCQLVALLGIGGIGKTALAVKLTQQMQGQFEQVIWYSLYNAPPPVKELLENLLPSLPKQQGTDLSGSVGDEISRLIDYLQQHRCLIVLDNAESLLEARELAGAYRKEYQDYGKLLRAVGERSHQSCLVITSREKPQEVALLEAKTSLVQSLELKTLDDKAAKDLIEKVGGFALGDEEPELKKLIELYGGNTLALKIICSTIKALGGKTISNFLKEQGNSVFLGDLRNVLSEQFQRLSELEKEIMYWLAINRTPVSVLKLREDIISPVPQSKLLEALESLRRRSLIEQSGPEALYFMLHPVVMEYITEQLVQKICEEIKENKINFFNRYTLIKAQAEDYIKTEQENFIIKLIKENLLIILGNEEAIENQLKRILSTLPKQSPPKRGYAGGNIINLLSELKNKLIDEWDFSEIAVWQADLEKVNLHNVNFANADLKNSTFAEALSSILSVAFNSDGKCLATGEVNGKVRLWNVEDGKPLRICEEKHDSWVQSVAFSPDGKILARSSGDGTVKLWNVDTGECFQTLKEENSGPVRSVAFSRPDGKILASGSDDGAVRLWKKVVGTWQCYETLKEHKGWVWSVAFSPDGAILASGSEDKTVRLWDLRTGHCRHTLKEHESWVSSVAFSPDGAILASGSGDHKIRLWDVRNGQIRDTFEGHTSWVWSVAFFSPDGETRRLASSSDDCTIRLWNVDTGESEILGEKTNRIEDRHTNRIGTVAFSPDGKTLASGSEDRTVKFWDIGTKKCLNTLQGRTNRVGAVAFNRHGTLLASSNDDGTVKLWNVDKSSEAFKKNIQTLKGHEKRVGSVAFSPDGRILASGSDDYTVKLWKVGTWQCLRILKGHENRISSLAFSSDGEILASGSDDCTVRLWKVSTGEDIKTLNNHPSRLRSVAFAPKNENSPEKIATASDDGKVKVWNVDTGKCEPLKDKHWAWSIDFSPNGKTLACGNYDKTVRLWYVDDEKWSEPLKGHKRQLRSVAFSLPDGKILASGSDDHTVRLWDVDAGQYIETLNGHASRVTSVAFSPDGKTLASGSDDETIKLWDVHTYEFLASLESEKPYERTNIAGVIGLTNAQKDTLKELGAIEQ